MTENSYKMRDRLPRTKTRFFFPKYVLWLGLLLCTMYFVLYALVARSSKEITSILSPKGTYEVLHSPSNISVRAPGDMAISSPRNVKTLQYSSIVRSEPGTLVFVPGEVTLSSPAAFIVSSSGQIVTTADDLAVISLGNVTVSSDKNISFSDTGNISVITSPNGRVLLESRVANDAEWRKRAFLEKYVNCEAKESNALITVGRSCALNLKVASTAKDSMNFTFIQRKISRAWQEQLEPQVPTPSESPLKTILYWVERTPTRTRYGDHEFFIHEKCPVTNCQITANRTLVPPDQVDAILLNSFWMRGNRALPSKKQFVKAKMILQIFEVPVRHSHGFEKFNGLVDYTMGYRKDSDFPATNGFVRPRQWPMNYDPDDIKAKTWKKTKMAAWFVSNCRSDPSGRMTLTKSLQKHGIEVDIYGKCGALNCSKSQRNQCYEMLERDYKFYFSFENSLCNHYVTEKFYNALRYHVIPVTFGLGHEVSGAPKEAYIDVFDFPDVKSLAQYLQYLNSNDTAYNEYFRWKQFYEATGSFDGVSRHCKVCEMLVKNTQPERSYTNVAAWASEHQCLSAKNGALKDFTEGKPSVGWQQGIGKPKEMKFTGNASLNSGV